MEVRVNRFPGLRRPITRLVSTHVLHEFAVHGLFDVPRRRDGLSTKMTCNKSVLLCFRLLGMELPSPLLVNYLLAKRRVAIPLR